MVSITATDAGGMTPPRVGLSLAWDIDADVTIVRIDPDGTAHPVRGCEPLRLNNTVTWSGYDYEAPLNVDVLYEASADSGTRRVSGTVRCNATAFYPNDQGWSTARGAVWLRHLTIPSLSMPVDLANAESPSYAQTRTVVPVLNRAAPVVLTDARRKAPTTTLDIRTWSLEEAARLRELLADNSVLLLDVPAPERWGIAHWWVTVADVTEERLWQEWAPFEGRVFHLPVEVVDRPPGGTVYSGRNYWAAQRGVATYYQWQRMYGTYASLAATPASGGGSGSGGGGSGTVSNARTGTIHGTTHATGARSGRSRRTGTIHGVAHLSGAATGTVGSNNARTGTVHGTASATGIRSGLARRIGTVHGTASATSARSGRVRRTGVANGVLYFTGISTGATGGPPSFVADPAANVVVFKQSTTNLGALTSKQAIMTTRPTPVQIVAGQRYYFDGQLAVTTQGANDTAVAFLMIKGIVPDSVFTDDNTPGLMLCGTDYRSFYHGAGEAAVLHPAGSEIQFDTSGVYTFALSVRYIYGGALQDATDATKPCWMLVTTPTFYRESTAGIDTMDQSKTTVTLSSYPGAVHLTAGVSYSMESFQRLAWQPPGTVTMRLLLAPGLVGDAVLIAQGVELARYTTDPGASGSAQVLHTATDFIASATGDYTVGIALSATCPFYDVTDVGYNARRISIRPSTRTPDTIGMTVAH